MNPKLEAFMGRIESDELKTACVYELIDIYYQCVIGKIDEMDADDEREYEDLPFPDEFLHPVEDRKSGIGAALKRLLDLEYDVDVPQGGFNALMLAVGEGDAPMAHFLIQHGADANSWPEMGEEPSLGEGNYYLDDIDIHFMNECFANDRDEDYLRALHRTALVLVEDANLGPYSGYSLKIDEEGQVSLGPAKVKF